MITAAEIVALCQESGFTVTAEHSLFVTAERPIPGHPGDARGVVFQHNLLPPRGAGWRVTLHRRRLEPTLPAGYQWNPEPIHEGGPFSDLLTAGLWFGGVCCVPVDDAEVHAIQASTPVAA